MDGTLARNCPASAEPGEQAAQLLDEFAAGAVLATIKDPVGATAHHRLALVACGKLRARASATTLTAALELRARTGPA